jgi:hypothetical protein
MDASTIIGIVAFIGILWLCSKVAKAGGGQGEHRSEQELDARFGKGRNQRTEDSK